MTSENLYQTFVSKHFDFLNDEVRKTFVPIDFALSRRIFAQDSIHEMFPIIAGAPDYGDEDDGPLMSFDDPPNPVEHEVRRDDRSPAFPSLVPGDRSSA